MCTGPPWTVTQQVPRECQCPRSLAAQREGLNTEGSVLWRLPTAAYPEAPDGARSRAGEALFREFHATCLQGEPWTWQGRDTGLSVCLRKMRWNR